MSEKKFVNTSHQRFRKEKGWFRFPQRGCAVCQEVGVLSEIPEAKVVCSVCQMRRPLAKGVSADEQRGVDVTIAHRVYLTKKSREKATA